MRPRLLAASLGIALSLAFAGPLRAQDEGKPDRTQSKEAGASKARTPKGKGARGKAAKGAAAKGKGASEPESDAQYQKATFGGGCFWCLEAVFERVKGVKSVVSGYAGGTVPRPSYELVCTGTTGHAEVVQITYDPKVVTFDDLLKVFWECHDPTSLNRQGPDEGTQYRSIILYHDDEQKEAAQKSYEVLTAAGAFMAPIVTQLVPLKKFYPAERYHQDYYRRHKNDEYCQIYIVPKLMKLNAKAQGAAKP